MGFDQLSNMWTAVFPLAVLLYYFFRKKYVTTTISSTLFWENSMRETKVSPYLKNLQRNALFYLQMAALLLLLFILLAPFLPKETVMDSHTVFVVDTSASMGVTDGDLSLFERNKEKMINLAEERAGNAISIITTGKEPSLLLRKETDTRAVLAAIDKLGVQYEHEHMARSIDFAKSIALQDGADVHIFTDFLDRSVFVESVSGITWTVHNNESPSVNIAIEKFGAVSTVDGTEAIIKLSNQSKSKQSGKVIIKNELTDESLSEQEFSVNEEADILLSFKGLPLLSAVSAVLQVQDDYQTDNEAFVMIGNESSEVIVDSQLHELVKKAFEAIGLTVTTGSVKKNAMARDQAMLVTNDPSFLLEGSDPILLLGRNDSSTEPVSGVVDSVNDSLFTIASINDIYVSAVYPPFEGYTTLASIDGKPFIQRSQRGDIIVLSDIALTDWPLHPSFPLFIWSTAETLRSANENVGTFTPNERKAVLTSGGSDGIEIFTIEDKYVVSYPNGRSFVAPSVPGVYKMIDGGTEKYLSVQLEPNEKVVSSGMSYRIGFVEVDSSGKEEGKSMIGWLFLLPVLLLLLIEWEVQRRRGYPN
ncbi:BatA and WFA domain-containing protein [Sporosarcina thermotolerans]|uniref:BatA and WFA domain-containing protein n=1 Tax=Sporosarcina thermotolerans TaxID=633404 RepID=A0AAW9A4Z1_9BACL|nr:BatA and WFA domain-containing protein [Sporosarcina thermotolerans]MDW0115889.1 BatA and WFA domain-containing protein [Sporosarcina thermotolerans]